MDQEAQRQALMRYLQMSQANQVGDPNDGNNYGYMSSMPLNKTPTADASLGILQLLGGAGALAATPFQGPAAPLSGLAGMYLIGDGGRRVGRNGQQLRGIHPDQAEMDQYVNDARYYGQRPMGPR